MNPAYPIMLFVTNLASPTSFFLLSIAIIGMLLLHNKRKDAIDFFFVMLIASIVVVSIKQIIQRPRPLGMTDASNFLAVHEIGYSFPSAHALVATVFFLCIAHFYESHFKSKFLKSLFILVNILIVILIGFSRVYLGVHYLTDVVGGFVIGVVIFIMFFAIRKFRKHK